MEKASLESAIREEAEQAIKDIAEKEAAEIKRLDEAYATQIEAFRKQMEDRTDARIRQESSKAQSRAGLDLKKSKLRSLEAFINRTVEKVVKDIGNDSRYKKFILDAVSEAVGRIPAGAEVRLRKEDLVREKEIRETIEAGGGTGEITIAEDKMIKWGGCIVVDRLKGRIFDCTIERIYFRRAPAIRREIVRLLSNPPKDAT